MKKFLACLGVLLVTVTAFAALKGSPFPKPIDKRFDTLETGVSAYTDGSITEPDLKSVTSEGLNASRIARVTYDVAVDLGTVAAHPLGVTLPANAIVLQVWFYVVTQFVDAGAGTVAIHCEDANNLYTASDVTGMAIGAITAGAADGRAEATYIGSIAAACEVTATVATAAQTAGKMIIYIEYVVAE